MISVVIVTYGKAGDVAACLASIARIEALASSDIVLVDNLGDPQLDTVVRETNLKTTVLRPAGNLGYGGAINFARPYLLGTWIMILNPDVQLKSFDNEAFLALDVASPLRMLGPVTYGDDGELIASFSHVFPSPYRDPLRELSLLSDGRPISVDETKISNESPVAWISGAAMLLSCAAFDLLGGFDSSFFLYYEDIDLCNRASVLGVKVSLAKTWRIQHSLHSTTPNSSQVVKWRYRSKKIYFEKHCDGTALFIHTAASVAVLLLKLAGSLVWRWRDGGSRTNAYLWSLGSYFRSAGSRGVAG